jgi:hypothetical protein
LLTPNPTVLGHRPVRLRTPEEFRLNAGYADVESNQRFPHPHSLDYDGCEIISKQNQNGETPVITGEKSGAGQDQRAGRSPSGTLQSVIGGWSRALMPSRKIITNYIERPLPR